MIYLDNSATTYPKPAAVIGAVNTAMREYSFNPGRGGYKRSIITAEKLYNVRTLIKDFFHVPSEERVIFTSGCTCALNAAIKGSLKKGNHVIISSMEHNSVYRPVHKLKTQGLIDYSIAEVFPDDDDATVNSFRSLINSKTRMIICTHASNAFGFTLPVERICALAHTYGILFCLDAAQSAGVMDINLKRDRFDYVCCAGHKYLYGPMGTGLLLLGGNSDPDTLIEGGTGSAGSSGDMPDYLPDKMEPGTMNVPGILGLAAGIRFTQQKGIENIYRREKRMIDQLRSRLSTVKGVKLYGSDKPGGAPIISFSIDRYDSEEVSRILAERYNIAVRGGLHCAPLAHQAMGTAEHGCVRVSPSVFTTEAEINTLASAVIKICNIR